MACQKIVPPSRLSHHGKFVSVLDAVCPLPKAEGLAECIGGQSAELIAAASVIGGTETGSPADGDLATEQAAGDGINGSAELDRVNSHFCEASWKA